MHFEVVYWVREIVISGHNAKIPALPAYIRGFTVHWLPVTYIEKLSTIQEAEIQVSLGEIFFKIVSLHVFSSLPPS